LSVLRLSEYLDLANVMLGAVFFDHCGLGGVVFLGVHEEPLSVIEWDVGRRIEVQVNVLEVLTLPASAIHEAVLVVLAQNVLRLGAVETTNIAKEVLLQVTPDTGRHVETWENGVDHS
jgi:hypothetical protein